LAEIRWSGPALDDLETIRAYIANDNLDAAEGVLVKLITAGEGLATFPDRARPRANGRRELTTVQPYVILYRHADDIVTILRVRHGARDPE
jgi:addiction module RelE/StbE family toxin